MNTQGKIKIQVWMMILLVFVLGGITGASIDHLYSTKIGSNRPGTTNNSRRRNMIERMRKDLNLTDDQTQQVRTIYEATRREFQPRSAAECPVFKEMRDKTRERIRAILTSEQQRKYDERNARRDAERAGRAESGDR